MNREERIKQISAEIKQVLQTVDFFCGQREGDVELLDECLTKIGEHNSFNEAAMPVILAFGGKYSPEDVEIDRNKKRTLELLIGLVKNRIEGRELVKKKYEDEQNRAGILNQLFGIGGGKE